MNDIRVEDVRLVTAPAAEQTTGLIGWVSFRINGIVHVDGVGLRRTRAGFLALSFPKRRGGDGRLHPIIWPAGDRARRDIEHQVLSAIRLAGGQAP